MENQKMSVHNKNAYLLIKIGLMVTWFLVLYINFLCLPYAM